MKDIALNTGFSINMVARVPKDADNFLRVCYIHFMGTQVGTAP